MGDWTGWAAGLFAFLLSILGINYRMEKQDNKKVQESNTKQFLVLSNRLTVIETQIITERELRSMLKDYFESFIHPLIATQDQIQSDVLDIKLCLARLPKRKKDNDGT